MLEAERLRTPDGGLDMQDRTPRTEARVNPLQGKLAGRSNGFVSKLNPQGNALVYSTYVGGTGNERGNGIAVDALRPIITANQVTLARLVLLPDDALDAADAIELAALALADGLDVHA